MLTKDIIKIDKLFEGEVFFEEKLSLHTTMRTGGKTPLWFIPQDIDDLINFLEYINFRGFKSIVLGNGSNVIVEDKDLECVFINLSSSYFEKYFLKKNVLTVRAGGSLKKLISCCMNKNLSGLEFFSLIPAVVGGAVVTNAKINFNSKKRFFWDIIEKIKVIDKNTGIIKTYLKKNIKSWQDFPNFENKILLEVDLRLEYSEFDVISNSIEKMVSYRKKTQDYSLPSCGCIFKNPPGSNAGRLIQDAGLKGKKVGGAMVSLKHANFILNSGDANSKDICLLIELVKDKVFEKYGILLEEEIELIG